MKKNITKEQFLKLTDEQKNKIRDMWQPEYGDFYFQKSRCRITRNEWEDKIPIYDDGEYSSPDYVSKMMYDWTGTGDKMYPCFNIMQMAEILNKIGTVVITEDICDELWNEIIEFIKS